MPYRANLIDTSYYQRLLNQPPHDALNQYKLPIIVICAGIIAAICIFVLTINMNTRNLEKEFNGDSKLQVSIFKDWLTLNVNEVERLSRFLAASNSPESMRELFHMVVGSTINREVFNGIYLVSANGSGRHLEVRSAVTRGTDPEKVLEQPFLAKEIALSLRTKKPVATSPLVFSDDPERRNKIAIIAPILQKGHTQRVIMAVLDPGMLIETLRRQGNFDKAEEYIFDMQEDGSEQMIYGKANASTRRISFYSSAPSSSVIKNISAFSYAETIPLLNRQWKMLFVPTNRYISKANTFAPWLLMTACMVLSVLTAAFLYHLIGQNVRTEQIVRERTAKLLDIGNHLKAQSLDLLKAKIEAETANKAKSDFLANVSHEMRTPLSSMIGLSELMLETDLTTQQEHNLRTVLNSGELLLELINNMLDFSKIESGKLELDLIPFDLQAAIEDTAELFLPKTWEKEKQLELLVHFTPGTPRYVIGDAIRIRQIISNLINNAIKFTHAGYILVKTERIEDPVPEGFVKIKISVQDTGIGIPKNKLDVIFEKFTQADNSTTRKFGGTGLGLSICKQLAQLMHGEVAAESVHGQGSTFSFTVTLERDQEEEKPESPRLVSSSILRGKKTLIVDDVKPSITILSEQLASMGMLSVATHTPSAALEILAEAQRKGTPFDLLITDYILPEMESDAFTQRVKDIYPDMPVIMVTALAERGYMQLFASSGCDACLTKPVKTAQLLDILNRLFEARHAGRGLSMLTPEAVSGSRKPSASVTQEDNGFLESAEILLVEDNKANRDLGIRLLENFACHPTIARNGEEAIDIIRKRPFDLILMDCQMPEMDGFEASSLLREMKERGEIADIPIIALTANAMKGDKEKCLESGMNDYLTKPLRRNALRNILMEWLPPKEKRLIKNNDSWAV